MGDKSKCRVVIKGPSGKECTLAVEECREGSDGDKVIVVKCDPEAADCCCPEK
jgi:hypothetical protein